MTKKDRTVTLDLTGGWVCEMVWPAGRVTDGPETLTIRPAVSGEVPGNGLSSTVLREVSFGAALAEIRRRQKNPLDPTDRDTLGVTLRLAQLKSVFRADGISDRYLAELAAIYVSMIDKQVDKPLEQIAKALGGKTVSTVRGHLWQARKRGLMEGGSSGRQAGGQLTERGLEVLRTL